MWLREPELAMYETLAIVAVVGVIEWLVLWFVIPRRSPVKNEEPGKCSDCKHWNRMGVYGECKRHAPTRTEARIAGGWPTTHKNESCGDFERGNTKADL